MEKIPHLNLAAAHKARPARLLLLLTVDWLVIAISAWIWESSRSPCLLPLLWLAVGSRQHAIAAVMHETVHQRLSSAWGLSKIVGLVCAWPLFISWNVFRQNHLEHHKHLNSSNDPDLQFKLQNAPADWEFPKSPVRLTVLLTKDLFGYGVVSNMRRFRRYISGPFHHKPSYVRGTDPVFIRCILTAAFVLAWIAMQGWTSFVLLWVVPLFTTLPFMLRVRSISEHFHVPLALPMATRNIRASWFEREVLGFGPHSLGYHVVHHRWPGIPFHCLKAVDRQLQSRPDYEGAYMHIDGYLLGRRPLIRQLMTPRGAT